jgi:Ca2+-transporting ATPase
VTTPRTYDHVGLTAQQAAERLAADGPNTVASARPVRWPVRVGRQLADPLLLLLLASAAVTAALGDFTDMAVILLVIVVNTTVGVTQEVRADQAIAALRQIAPTTARVRRDGVDELVPTEQIVRHDVLVLAQGDVVPADATLVQSEQLRLDESSVTGESVPVSRTAGEEVSAGTTVVAGRALAEVVRTGAQSALGRIAALVLADQAGGTPLQRRLNALGRQLGAAVIGLSALVAIIGIIAGRPVVEMAITGVSLVVAAIPESLPAVVTLALALGAMRMARGHAIARRLHAVETLGSVTILAVDKTGTLTEGRMAVARAVLPDGTVISPQGTGYDPAGRLDGAADGSQLARASVLCNDARLVPPTSDSPEWTVVGDPVEGALLAFAGRCGVDDSATRDSAPRCAEEPFDASIRRMTTVHPAADGVMVVCKGAPEVVLDPALTTMDAADRRRMTDAARGLAEDGLRVLAVAAGPAPSTEQALPPHELTPLGLVGIHDPVRPAAADVAGALASAGIRLVMVTGDHPATARAVARRLGIADDSTVDEPRVYARVRPEEKLDIVGDLQTRGEVVAMTGDGVNDAPALRRADIGVAMGRGGTEVARQAADLILADDNLATVTVAVREGRRIYENIRRFLRYALSGGLAEILVMLLGPAFGFPLPLLLPAQILWVNLLTHGLPGVALGAEPADPGTMHRPPRPPRESVLGDGLAWTVLAIGGLIGTVVLLAAAIGRSSGAPWQSMAFVTLGLAQLGVALAVRARRQRGRSGNPSLGLAVATSALLQVGAVEWSPLRLLLGTEALSASQWVTCLAAAVVPGLLVSLARLRHLHQTGLMYHAKS